MLTFRFTGVDGRMSIPETITTGMIGKQIRLEFSPDWDGLQKTAVFTGGDVVRSVRNVGEYVEIPHEVLQKPWTPLYVGVYGISADGAVAVPTVKVHGPIIIAGANPSEDEQTDPTLPVWSSMEKEIALLRTQLENLKGLSIKQISALDGMFRVCAYDGSADYESAYTAFQTAFGITDSEDSHVHSYASEITKAAACTVPGVSTFICSCGESYTEEIPATGHTYTDGICSVCGATDPDTDNNMLDTGVSSIRFLAERKDGIVTAGSNYVEPDNGYIIITNTSGHTGLTAGVKNLFAWPLISGKTYDISISNSDEANIWFGLCASTLDVTPVKGEITTVTDTVVKNIVAWGAVAAGAANSYTYTAGSGEYLLFWPDKAGFITITAEVTA